MQTFNVESEFFFHFLSLTSKQESTIKLRLYKVKLNYRAIMEVLINSVLSIYLCLG